MTTVSMNESMYVLYRETSSGLVVYKSDFVDGKHGHITRTTLQHKAVRHDLSTAAKRAADTSWMIKKVYTL